MGFDQRKTDIRRCQIGMRGIAYKYISYSIKVTESAADSRLKWSFLNFIPGSNKNDRRGLTGIYSAFCGFKHLLEEAGSRAGPC